MKKIFMNVSDDHLIDYVDHFVRLLNLDCKLFLKRPVTRELLIQIFIHYCVYYYTDLGSLDEQLVFNLFNDHVDYESSIDLMNDIMFRVQDFLINIE